VGLKDREINWGCPRKSFAGLVLVFGLFLPVVAVSQGQQSQGFFFEPSISVYELYDDNLIFTAEDTKSDLITRITPALETGFESEVLSIIGNYQFDAENYASTSELNSAQTRRTAELAISYQPNRRLSLTLEGDYTKTQTPADLLFGGGIDLGLGTGLLLERQGAEQTSVSPGLRYQMTQTAVANLDYSYTQQDLEDGISADTAVSEVSFEHDMSGDTRFLYGYRYREYEFSNANKLISNTPWLGLTRSFSPTTELTVIGGPRFNNDTTNTFLSLALTHDYADGNIRLSLDADEAAVLGTAGIGDSETIGLAVSRRFGPNIEVNFSPSIGRIEEAGDDVDVLNVSIEAYYRYSDTLMFTATANHSNQKGGILALAGGEITSNIVLVGFTWRVPSRAGRQRTLAL